jgi:hypothetical protein
MVPDEKFSDMIKSGSESSLDEEDIEVLRGVRSAGAVAAK